MADDNNTTRNLASRFNSDRYNADLQAFVLYLDKSGASLTSDLFFSATIDIAYNDYNLPADKLVEKLGICPSIVSLWADGKELPAPKDRAAIVSQVSALLRQSLAASVAAASIGNLPSFPPNILT